MNFPQTPTIGEIYTGTNGIKYRWDGVRWLWDGQTNALIGPQGPRGPTGVQGPVGPAGPAGPAGAASAVAGPQGQQGLQGLTGPQGPIGPTGLTGVVGPQGGAGNNIVGAVIYTAFTSPPTGYLKANGAAVSRASYAELFAVIGTMYGAGNGTSTFNLPDLRGEFIRGWDDGRGIDAGRVFGSIQLDEFKSHTHTTPTGGGAGYGQPAGASPVSASVTGATGGSETRPRNVALLACICCFASATQTAPTVLEFTWNVPAGTYTDMNLHAAAVAAGWNNTDRLTVNIPAGATIGASSTAAYALVVNGAYANSLVINNAGNILGRGGSGAAPYPTPNGPFPANPGASGGPAMYINSNCQLVNTGTIGGGGGGGASGACAAIPLPGGGGDGFNYVIGGAGGSGAGSNGGASLGGVPSPSGQIGGNGGTYGQPGTGPGALVGTAQLPGATAPGGGGGTSITGTSYLLAGSSLGTTYGTILN